MEIFIIFLNLEGFYLMFGKHKGIIAPELNQDAQVEEDYVELWEIIKSAYDNCQNQNNITSSLLGQFNIIDQQIVKQKNSLVISGQGKKTLLCAYYNHTIQKHNNIVCICFGSITTVYSDILSSIIRHLRHQLGINQKIQLNQQKLRRYFKYWLQVASKELYLRQIGETLNGRKIIIIIQGINKVTDSKGNLVSADFWIPSELPDNVKLILSVQSQDLLKYSNYSQIYHQLPNYQSKLAEEAKMPLIQLKTLNKIGQNNRKENGSRNLKEEIKQYIKGSSLMDSEETSYLLLCLVYSRKGLKQSQIKLIKDYKKGGVEEFLNKFSFLICNFKELYTIWNPYFRSIIQSLFDQNGQKERKIHIKLASILNKQPTSLRKLQELIYHLIRCGNYLELKQTVSRVQNFLMLYSPPTKHLLCQCWVKLENLQHDPVFQYNKSVQGFLNHYYPTQEEIFKIVFQLSLFFKEYAQFQNWKTPMFMHPQIRAETQLLTQISINDELQIMNMVGKIKSKRKQQISLNNSLTLQKSRSSRTSSLSKISVQSGIQETKNMEKTDKIKQDINENDINKIIGLNTFIQGNQQKFKEFYLSSLHNYIKQFVRKEEIIDKSLLSDDSDEQEDYSEIIQENHLKIQTIKQCLLLKNYQQYRQQSYHRRSEKSSYYYYKQWLWLQFPWIGQSLSNNYSELIKLCIKSPTQYMSVNLEHTLCQQALKIAQIARENKLKIYKKGQMGNLRHIISGSSLRNKSLCASKKKGYSELKQTPQSKWNDQLSFIYNSKIINSPINAEYSGIFLTQESKISHILQKSSIKKLNKLKRLQMKQNTCQENQTIPKTEINGSQQNLKYQRKLNLLLFQNKTILNHIQKLKNTLAMFQAASLNANQQKIQQRLMILQTKKTSINKNFIIQNNLKQKLQTVKKVCQLNKSHGSESEELNLFLQSLRKMTQSQRLNNDLKTKDIQNTICKIKEQIKHYNEIKHSLQQKINLQKTIIKSKTYKGLKTVVQNQGMTAQNSRFPTPQNEPNCRDSDNDKIDLMELNEELKLKIQKNSHLKFTNEEIKDKNLILNEQLEQLKKKYQIKTSSKEYSLKAAIKSKIREESNKLQNIKNRKQLFITCLAK